MEVSSPSRTVAANVKAEMARRSHSQSTFAPLIGMRQQALSRRLSGKTSFTVDELATIAATLDMSVTDLLVNGEFDRSVEIAKSIIRADKAASFDELVAAITAEKAVEVTE